MTLPSLTLPRVAVLAPPRTAATAARRWLLPSAASLLSATALYAQGHGRVRQYHHTTNHRAAAVSGIHPTSQSLSPAVSTMQQQQKTNGTPSPAVGLTSSIQIEKIKSSYVLDHHIYKKADLDSIFILHYKPRTLSDRLAWLMVKLMRGGFDLATRYPSKRDFSMIKGREKDVVKTSTQARKEHEHKQHEMDTVTSASTGATAATTAAHSAFAFASADVTPLPKSMALDEMRAKGLSFTPSQWLQRFIFLESVAGVPGMVAATARHLHSLRLLRRDGGWIHELLQDAENERMHLLSFLKISQPGWRMRGLLVITQGVFYNFLFLLYLISPRLVHRFVGILEEEAVKTYTQVLEDLSEGRLPEWEQLKAPEIALEYWKLPEGATMGDMIKVIRADEASHRFIHHSLANLDSADTNPFSVASPAPKMIGGKLSLERNESMEYVRRAREGQGAVPGDTGVAGPTA